MVSCAVAAHVTKAAVLKGARPVVELAACIRGLGFAKGAKRCRVAQFLAFCARRERLACENLAIQVGVDRAPRLDRVPSRYLAKTHVVLLHRVEPVDLLAGGLEDQRLIT